MKQFIFVILKWLGFNIEKIHHYSRLIKGQPEVIENVNNANVDKRCLLIYIIQPFQKNVDKSHQNLWQVKEIARLIGNKGFVVDATNYLYEYVSLHYNYDLVIGLIPRGIDIYTKHMNPGCKQIAYLTSMNLSVTSGNEEKRIEECYKRRGVRLKPRRFAGYIEQRIEQFDGTWYIGNEYNFQSYSHFKMPPSFRIINTGYVFPWADPNIERDPHYFMYFGSAGQVHKGLDLLLELFAEEIKDCTLYVCGSFASEEDFATEYHKELFETSNIIPIGHVNIETPQYEELSRKCAYSIMPSCAEGCAGSVLTNMSAGIIPIVSKECGFEEDEVINLSDCKKETIKSYILEYSKKDQEWLKEQSRKSIQIVKEHYSDSAFTKSVEEALDGVLGESNKGNFVIKSKNNIWQD